MALDLLVVAAKLPEPEVHEQHHQRDGEDVRQEPDGAEDESVHRLRAYGAPSPAGDSARW